MNREVCITNGANQIGGVGRIPNLLEVLGCDEARNFSSLVTAHSVGHHKHGGARPEVVLVAGSDLTGMGCCTPNEFGHQITEPQSRCGQFGSGHRGGGA